MSRILGVAPKRKTPGETRAFPGVAKQPRYLRSARDFDNPVMQLANGHFNLDFFSFFVPEQPLTYRRNRRDFPRFKIRFLGSDERVSELPCLREILQLYGGTDIDLVFWDRLVF